MINPMSNPAELLKLSKNQLIEVLDETEAQLVDLEAQRVAVREEILQKIEGDAEIIGDRAFTKIKIYAFDVDINKAKELGATKVVPAKEAIDNSKLKKLINSGVKIKHTITERLMIRRLNDKTN